MMLECGPAQQTKPFTSCIETPACLFSITLDVISKLVDSSPSLVIHIGFCVLIYFVLQIIKTIMDNLLSGLCHMSGKHAEAKKD